MPLNVDAKQVILKVYRYFREADLDKTKAHAIELTARATGFSEATVFWVKSEQINTNEELKKARRKQPGARGISSINRKFDGFDGVVFIERFMDFFSRMQIQQ